MRAGIKQNNKEEAPPKLYKNARSEQKKNNKTNIKYPTPQKLDTK